MSILVQQLLESEVESLRRDLAEEIARNKKLLSVIFSSRNLLDNGQSAKGVAAGLEAVLVDEKFPGLIKKHCR